MEQKEMDMFKVLEQAMELKKIFSPEAENGTEHNPSESKEDPLDIKKLMQLVELFKLFGAMAPAEVKTAEKTADKEESIPKEQPKIQQPEVSSFEDDIFSPEIKTLKALVPFLAYNEQKTLALLLKVIEMKKIKDHYENAEIMAASINKSMDKDNKKSILKAIRPHMEQEKQYVIDMMEKVFEIQEIFAKMRSTQEL